MKCDICDKNVYSENDAVIFPSHSRERFVICNECKAKIKKKFLEEKETDDDRK